MSLSAIRDYRKNYVRAINPVTGRVTRSNGDDVARALALVPFDDLVQFSRNKFRVAYDHLNAGHARLCIGNRIRAAVRNGDKGVVAFLKAYAP
jgi:hypothetical protein